MSSYDVIVIGSGAGGGTLAHRLAPSGKRILPLERGDWLTREPRIGAVNPALTAMANGLRVGDHLLERLAAKQTAQEAAGAL